MIWFLKWISENKKQSSWPQVDVAKEHSDEKGSKKSGLAEASHEG
ncbi:MAG TPA: hypothetical protein VJ201_06195 [Candidatus Babeliales bacterium]|nr:hypothetical protein [Candidatus Babeliales bacterium]